MSLTRNGTFWLEGAVGELCASVIAYRSKLPRWIHLKSKLISAWLVRASKARSDGTPFGRMPSRSGEIKVLKTEDEPNSTSNERFVELWPETCSPKVKI